MGIKAALIAFLSDPQDAQPNLANAPPAGPHEPLRLRGDSSGNYLKPEDEAATTDEEVLLLYLSHPLVPLCCCHSAADVSLGGSAAAGICSGE